MSSQSNSFFTERIKSIYYAINGILIMLYGQPNALVHLFATILVVVAGLLCNISRLEWCILLIAVVLVWATEAVNTAIEYLCDLACPEYHPLIKKVKDIAAGVVLISAIGAVVLGLIVFMPYLKIYWLG